MQFLAGFGLTPNAMAVAPVATEAKVPMIVSNAATSAITTRSPYIARVSMTIPQVSAPMAEWALKNGVKQVYTVVADYGPGIDAETQFTKTFKAGGGEVVGTLRTPLQNPDFSAAIQRVKDAKPQAVFVFLPAGEQGIAFVKGFNERGLAKEGIKLIATGDITDDHVLDAMGDPTLGLITSFHYSAAHDSPENAAFLKNYAAANDAKVGRPNFMAAAGYDTMAAIYEAVRKGGDADGDKAMAALKGYKWVSPRGPVMIDRGHARHRADRVHPQGREEGRQARQRRVRQDRERQGSGQGSREVRIAAGVRDADAGAGSERWVLRVFWLFAYAPNARTEVALSRRRQIESAMKNPWTKRNPFMSMWLSAANTAAGSARSRLTAASKRQASTMMNAGIAQAADFWTKALTPPIVGKKRRRCSK